MGLIKSNEILQNDVLMGLLGKACHCADHDPFAHFGILPDSDVEIQLLINGKELSGAAGFLQAYYRQYEKLIGNRVRGILEDDLKRLRSAITNLASEAQKKVAELFPSKDSDDESSSETV
jgi:hypothetical protein